MPIFLIALSSFSLNRDYTYGSLIAYNVKAGQLVIKNLKRLLNLCISNSEKSFILNDFICDNYLLYLFFFFPCSFNFDNYYNLA